MQRISLCLMVALLLAGSRVFAQQVNTPVDSLPAVLCHAWVANHMILTFMDDHTLTTLNTQNKDKVVGTWSFDPANKVVLLVVKGQKNGAIVSLSGNTLTMLTTPDDPAGLKVVYQRRQL